MKVSELDGADLDYWVAKALGYQRVRIATEPGFERDITVCMASSHGTSIDKIFQFSTDWSQGGPIIERERISIMYVDTATEWKARVGWEVNCQCFLGYGPTPLIAAMRAYVASKLGEEV